MEGNVFSAGFQLLVLGMSIVFTVLLVLMLTIKILAKFSGSEQTPAAVKTVVNATDSNEEEIAAIMAVISKKLPDSKNYVITINS